MYSGSTETTTTTDDTTTTEATTDSDTQTQDKSRWERFREFLKQLADFLTPISLLLLVAERLRG